MGREVMRVPLDFDCPIGETWSGRLNPHHPQQCDACKGYGRDDSYRTLEALVRLVMLAGSDSARHGKVQHPYFRSAPVEGPAPKLHEVTAGLAGRAVVERLFGHDACDQWAATRAILKAAGLDPETWGTCPACAGSGYAPGQEEAVRLSEEWGEQEHNPQKGDGWQLWQTVSEGGPVSPVFATPEELARWMATPGNDTSITRGWSYEQWLAFITGPGWAPSMMSAGGPPVSGVEFATRDA